MNTLLKYKLFDKNNIQYYTSYDYLEFVKNNNEVMDQNEINSLIDKTIQKTLRWYQNYAKMCKRVEIYYKGNVIKEFIFKR